MLDNAIDTTAPSDPLATSSAVLNTSADWYLIEYIKFANKGMRFPVTLYCSGLLVSGILIGGREYFEQSALQVVESFSDTEVKEVINKWVKSFADIYPAASSDNDGDKPVDDDDDLAPPTYIHLMNAKVFTPGQVPIPGGKEGLLWRGRLSSVDGFTWGKLAVSS